MPEAKDDVRNSKVGGSNTRVDMLNLETKKIACKVNLEKVNPEVNRIAPRNAKRKVKIDGQVQGRSLGWKVRK